MQVASVNEGRWAHTMAGDCEYEQCIKVNCFFAFLWYLTVKFKLLGMLAFYFTFAT